MIIVLFILAYIFMGVLTFRILEIKKIGFESCWYEDDKSTIWAFGAIIMSIFWIITLPTLFMYILIDKLFFNKGIK